MRPAKPLWGFGWVGWCLLPVAAVLAWVYFSGYDLRFHVLKFIADWRGINTLFWFVTGPLMHQYFGLRTPGLSVLGLTYVWVAFWIVPRRVGWWWWTGVAVWSVLRMELMFWLISRGGGWVLAAVLIVAGAAVGPGSAGLAVG